MKFSKKGDRGFTSLLGGRRVSKADPRPETYGTLDEAASALGLAKASAVHEKTREALSTVRGRIGTIADLYTMLYSDGSTRAIYLNRYIRKISESLISAGRTKTRSVELFYDAEEMEIDPPDTLLGLYQGRPLTQRSVFEPFAMPDRIPFPPTVLEVFGSCPSVVPWSRPRARAPASPQSWSP